MRLISEPRPVVQPSAYDEEAGMSPAQLINRWDAIISEASRRFHIPGPGSAPSWPAKAAAAPCWAKISRSSAAPGPWA